MVTICLCIWKFPNYSSVLVQCWIRFNKVDELIIAVLSNIIKEKESTVHLIANVV